MYIYYYTVTIVTRQTLSVPSEISSYSSNDFCTVISKHHMTCQYTDHYLALVDIGLTRFIGSKIKYITANV